jgi:hypothetical protein
MEATAKGVTALTNFGGRAAHLRRISLLREGAFKLPSGESAFGNAGAGIVTPDELDTSAQMRQVTLPSSSALRPPFLNCPDQCRCTPFAQHPSSTAD